jgi:hypothetical protein
VKLRVEKGPKGTTKLQQVLGTCEDTAFEQDQIDELEIWDIFFSSNNTEAASIPADGFLWLCINGSHQARGQERHQERTGRRRLAATARSIAVELGERVRT